jgi:thiol-disulfide isomerase/thioredoxin
MSRAAARSSTPPDRRKIALYVTLAVVVVAIVAAVGFASRVPKAASDAPMLSKLKAGDPAPTFSVPTNAGTFDLAQVSTPVLLEVFATWCPHCQRETAVLDDLAATYAGKLAIVAVSGSPQGMDGNSPESQADVNAFGAQYNVKYPLAFDPELKVAQLYLQGGFPTLVLIDRAKKVSWVQSGEVPAAALTKAIAKTL